MNNDLKAKLKDFFPSRNVNGIIETFSWVVGVVTFMPVGKQIKLDDFIKNIAENNLVMKNNEETLLYLIYKNMGISPFWTLFYFKQRGIKHESNLFEMFTSELLSTQMDLLEKFKKCLFNTKKINEFNVPCWKLIIEFEWLGKIKTEIKSDLESESALKIAETFLKDVSKFGKEKSQLESESSYKISGPEVFLKEKQLFSLQIALDDIMNEMEEVKKIFVELNSKKFEKQHLNSLICNQSPLSGLILLILLEKIKELMKKPLKSSEDLTETIEYLDGVFTIIEKWKFSSEEYIRFVDFKKNFLIEVIINSLFYGEFDKKQIDIIMKEFQFMPSLFEMKEIIGYLKKRESFKQELITKNIQKSESAAENFGESKTFATILQTKKKLIQFLLVSKDYSDYLESFQGCKLLENKLIPKDVFTLFQKNLQSEHSDILLLLNVNRFDNEKEELKTGLLKKNAKKNDTEESKEIIFENESEQIIEISNEKADKRRNLLQIINNRDPNLINNATFVESLLDFYQKSSTIAITKSNTTANKAFNINMKSNREKMRTLFELLTTKNIGNRFQSDNF